jgi:hypothetical protein
MVSAHCRNLRWLAVIAHDAGVVPAQGTAPQRGDSFDSLFADSADRPRRTTDPFAPCSVQYTSGTTSRPKAVLWTHANALWGAKINAAHQDLHEGDVHQTYLPLFHTNALGRVEERRGDWGHAPSFRFRSPLIEPDMRISRIRLSDKRSCLRPRQAARQPRQPNQPPPLVEVPVSEAIIPSALNPVLSA